MSRKELIFFSDYLTCPLAALGLWLAVRPYFGPTDEFVFLACVIAGLLAWTPLEYLIHRYVFHHMPFIRDMHAAHHRAPRSLDGWPPLLSSSLAFLLVFVPFAPLSLPVAAGSAIGVLFGYLAYTSVHAATHHFRPTPGSYLYVRTLYHARHHYSDEAGNYGVTTDFWDRLFGTVLKGPRKPA